MSSVVAIAVVVNTSAERGHRPYQSAPLATSGPRATTPKPVPPPPPNTPLSTPPTSPTKSLGTITIDSFKKTSKMAKQKTQRAEKRHLVRWNDEMDKKLLLTVQYECNSAGVGIPWNKVGATMGENITGGAVIQHLAKLRSRMVEQDLSVPPPLRRGGGNSRISTSNTPSGSKARVTPAKIGKAKATPNATNSKLGKVKKAGKKPSGSDDSDSDSDDDNAWNDDDSDAEYGEPRAKRIKTISKGPMRRKVSIEDSDKEPKRKHKSSKPSSGNRSAYGYTDINGKPINDESDSDNETKSERLGAGKSWLHLEDDEDVDRKASKKKSLVVSLPNTPSNMSMVGNAQEKESGSIDYESEDDAFGGGIESNVDGTDMLINQEVNEELPTSAADRFFHDLAGPQFEPVSGSANHGGMNNNNNSYYDESNATFFDRDHQDHQSLADVFVNDYNNPTGFQASGGLFEEDGFVNDHTMEQSMAFQSNPAQDFEFDQMSNDFNGHSTGAFNDLHSSHLRPIQTSWSSDHGFVGGSSANTSVNQTPSGPSAGTDFGTGYFGNPQYDFGSFDGANIDFSADDGADTLFNVGNFDGDFIGGGMYGSEYFGN